MPDFSQGIFKFGAGELKARGAHARVAHADFLLDQLDELHKLRHGVHSQEGQEPVVERHRFLAFAIHRIVEKID